jgi:myo-inositol 2-dehydrogenase/D-chiro-inositol 1-dehydrogenase
MSRVAIGLIGYGAWGKHHARAIRETPGCELVAVCARTDESRRLAAAETGAAVDSDYRGLLARPDLDAVDIVAPNYLHEEVACAALAAGKHVLLEKPMATSVEACDRILAAASRAQRLLLVGHEMRFAEMYRTMRVLIDSGRLGKPRYVLIDLWRRPYRPGADGWRLDPARVGNWILEEPVHFFDVAAWFLEGAGEPETVFARGNRSEAGEAPPGVNDNFTSLIGYRGGEYALISQSLAAVEHHLSIKVFGSRAMLRAEWHAELDRSERPAYSLEISEEGHLTPVAVATTPGEFFELREELAAFAAAIRGEAELPVTGREARRAVALCLEAQRSLETGQIVVRNP